MAPPAYRSRQYQYNRKLILAYSPPCALCGNPGADTADHILPVSKGGTGAITNLQPAHRSCNSAKNDRTIIRYTAAW